MAKKRSLKEALTELLDNFEEDDDAGDADDDVITLRGPSARALLGILEGSGGGDPKRGSDDDPEASDDPGAEPAPQRSQSRYFGTGQ